MGSSAGSEYAAFEEKVKRTVYIDNLSPHVTEPILRTAIDQFGTVKSVHFIPNYTEAKSIPQCALVEMKTSSEANAVVSVIDGYPFMISGMPRPVRARHAQAEMFDDRPSLPGRQIKCHWLGPNDPDFEVANRLKKLTKKHAAEASFLLKNQLKREEELSKRQNETLKANYRKYELINGVMHDKSVDRLADRYSI